jgi:hypothetical protein
VRSSLTVLAAICFSNFSIRYRASVSSYSSCFTLPLVVEVFLLPAPLILTNSVEYNHLENNLLP